MGIWFIILILLFSSICEGDELPGWKDGRISMAMPRRGMKSVLRLKTDAPIIDPTRVTNLAWKPRAFLYTGFLSEEECDHLINIAKNELQRSAVADNESGKSVLSEVRTSSGMFIPKNKDEIVARIEDRIAAWTFLPKENGEAMQILRYEHGQKYDPHYDYFHDKINQVHGGHRVATVLMYLSDVIKGGETVFLQSEKDKQEKDDTWSKCGKRGVSVKPRKGDALLFFSLSPDVKPDPASLHAGCQVIEGEKWSATKWIHVKSFDHAPEASDNACDDKNVQCAEWAAFGECQKNPSYMIGTAEAPGFCRKSCRSC